MLRRMSFRSFFLIATASLFFAGCADDPENGGGGGGGSDPGTSSLDVSGALNTTHEGIAEYELDDGELASSWRLYMHDVSPEQTFSMVISAVGAPPVDGQEPTIANPVPGTYVLGGPRTSPANAFDVQYLYYGEGYDGEGLDGREPMWSTLVQGEGEFIVTEYSDEKLVGSFTLDVYHALADDRNKADEDSKITIKGDVTAVPK